MLLIVLMVFPVLWNFECTAKPVEQGSVTDATGEVTPYPDAQKRFIDINHVSPEVSNILRENNMNLDQIQTLKTKLQNRTHGSQPLIENYMYEMFPSSTYPTPTKEFDEQIRLLNIRNSLVKTLREGNESDPQSNSEFDYTLGAVCDMPRFTNASEWFSTQSWNILFKPNYRQYNVKSIIMRLFKVAAAGSKGSKECDTEVGEFYKITVSVYQRKRKEMKKRQIFAKLIKKDFNGWVEIDALATMKFWDHPKNNYGIAIDIYDDNDNQLDAKEHFHLQNCEAGPQIPWRAFQLVAQSFGTTVSEDDVETYRNMYTGPRLDITSSSPANYFLTNSAESQQPEPKSTRHLRHTHHRHLQRASSEESEESRERKSHQTTAQRRDHTHRKVEET